MIDERKIRIIEQRIGYTFKDKNLLVRAFTHSSFVNENKDAVDYQRLEYLGDSIIGFLCAEDNYLNSSSSEGKMTDARKAKVSTPALASDMDALCIFDFIRTGKGASSIKNNDKLKADVVEALAAAIYLDSGRNMAAVRNFICVKLFRFPRRKIINPS